MSDRLQLALMNMIPKNTISRAAGKFAYSSASRLVIPSFARKFNIDLEEAEKDIEEYPNLVQFFTRRLKEGKRPIDESATSIVSPVDGRVAQVGTITDGQLVQAKGVYYTVEELLGGDKERAKRYNGGSFLTVYLSPTDYHRIHTAVAGKVTGYTYVPGTLFPVNPFGVRAVAGLFARNERLITYFDTVVGEVALVKVGATIVGSVKVDYDESVGTNIKGGKLTSKTLDGPVLDKGGEVGRFEFGSTIILLFEQDAVEFSDYIQPDAVVRMGEKIGEMLKK